MEQFLNGAADLLAVLGVDAGVTLGIVFLTSVLTRVLDRERKYTRWYPLLPVGFGVIAAAAFADTSDAVIYLQTFFRYALSYGGAATLMYSLLRKTIQGK
jgi:uncharacterized BrkB/YihY/UPF0761 family membrane protein